MSTSTYIIKFNDSSLAQANYYSDELRDALLDASSDIEVSIKRDDPTTMDFGGTLILILKGAGAAIAVAKAIDAWLKRRDTAVITIELTDQGKKVTIKDISKKDALKLMAIFSGKEKSGNG
jgi:hypothetical protein